MFVLKYRYEMVMYKFKYIGIRMEKFELNVVFEEYMQCFVCISDFEDKWFFLLCVEYVGDMID